MTDLLDQRVSDWINRELSTMVHTTSSSIHIEYLLGRNVAKSEILKVSVQAFLSVVNQMQVLQMPSQPTLVIPLQAISNRVTMAIPQSMAEIEAQLDDMETPSLHIINWNNCYHFQVYEEYRVTLNPDILGKAIDHVSLSYREFRDSIGITNKWEFSRGVYAEYCPHHDSY